MRIEQELKLDYDDVLFRPKRSTLHSRSLVDLSRDFKILDHEIKVVPIIAANMDTVGTFSMANALKKHKMLTALHKFYDEDSLIRHFRHESNRDHSIYTMGSTDDDLEKFKQVNLNSNPKWVCIDVANGYSEKFIDFVAKFRDSYVKKILIAGNVTTADVTEELILKGVNIVKIGIGPGSSCTTRLVAGVGIPQLSAVIECSDAAHGLNAHIIADGGCKTPGDVSKAFGGGADFVMLGSMLAGMEEGNFENGFDDGNRQMKKWNDKIVYKKDVPYIKFYGMSSEFANEKHFGGMKDYRAAEGKEILIEYKGKVDKTIQQILGGIRSSCTYIGAKRLKDVPKCATFVRVSNTHNKIYGK